jgi:hypothetical protein
LASTPAQGQPHSRHHPSRTSYSQINQYGDDGTTGGALAEPVSYTLPQPLDENGGGGREKNVSGLEKDLLLAFEEQEKSSSAPAPSSSRPRRPSVEPSHP